MTRELSLTKKIYVQNVCVCERERERERERDSEQRRENEISHLTGGDILLDKIERPNFNRQSLKGF